jgi:hypothetical protein
MCCFSRHITSVSNTNLFARASTDGRQYLVYSMKYEAADELAMILPLPVPPSPPEDAIRFIDLSGYPKFFDDLRIGFPEPQSKSFGPRLTPALRPAALKVHEVGSFEASFVPHQRDFARIDSRFRLPENVWSKLPQYRDWGFTVFKLKAGAKEVHPMAFEFPRRDSGGLFFPTVHIHDGKVHDKANFDHALYCQTENSVQAPEWEQSMGHAASFMAMDKTLGMIEPGQPIHRRRIRGMQKNEDIVVME